MKKGFIYSVITLCVVTVLYGFQTKKQGNNPKNQGKMKEEFANFIKTYEAKAIPLTNASCLAYFNASISGKNEDYDKYSKLSIELSNIYADKNSFAILKKIKESGEITDELSKRRLDILYYAYLGNQVDPKKLEEIINGQTAVEQKFSTFRATVGGKKVTDNELEEILANSKNSNELKEAYLSSKEVGKAVAAEVIALVKKRNEIARELGFKNYHDMSLRLSEQDPQEIEKLFDELDLQIRDVYIKEKSKMDDILAKQYNIKKEELMPWHYQNRFFQEAPKIYKVDLDSYYKDKNLEELTTKYYASIGLPIDAMLKKSDLYERKGKYQHAYCIDIERITDVRVVCNIKPNFNWMGTMLHEFGHASYDKFIDPKLPWDLQAAAHTFTTEAIAMMFGRLASNAQWMQDMVGINNTEKEKIKEDGFKSLKLQQLVFSRWAQVMFRFEKSLYENPDQDLNKLWWDLVEKYQMIKKPAGRNEPDWASKIHIASSPCYYHNYQLGELLASQLNHYICVNILKTKDVNNQSYSGRKEVGEYLKAKVFAPGMRYRWDEMIERATGEKLTPKYYAEQFVN
ncbi:MAG: M2 family metallopeptidase [Bacteroidota bacterium]|nr:M2 family metallopeptidase [Bacteroidota bacterium]